MTKVIDIEDRLRLEKKKKTMVEKGKKMEAVRKIIQCTRCLARCARCGIQFDTQEMYKRHKGPYRFCPGCQEEYERYMRYKESGEESPFYWHNREWRALWQSWLDYQQALRAYGESPEFIDLLREVEWDR
jgi:Pyruvate/2-oxoacid:ferredoxin oxidoreductase delta subunit